MATASSTTENNAPITTYMPPTTKNPDGYPLFNLCLIMLYTNKQLYYYYQTGAIYNINKAIFTK